MKNATMSVEISGSVVTFNFPDLEPLMIDVSALSGDVRAIALAHGVKQKCGDAAALSRDSATGKSATAGEKRAAVEGMIERLRTGMWNERTGGETGGALLNALCAAHPGKNRGDVGEWLRGRTEKEKRALRASKKLKPFLAEEPSGAGDALLAGFMD